VEAFPLPGARAATLLLPQAPSPEVVVRVGFRPGAPTSRGVAFDALWSLVRRAHPSASSVFYWLGTDLLSATKDAAAGRLRAPFEQSRTDTHFVVAPWHVPEIAGIGIRARYVPMPYELPSGPASPLPDRFSVLTYLPSNRFDFYGGREVFAAARAFPEVPFLVLGAGPAPRGAPPNVQYPGWVSSADMLYRGCVVVLRLVAHDGIGGTVLEGLAYGRHVIYTYQFPHVRHVPYGDERAAIASLGELLGMHLSGALELNKEGQAYVLSEHGEARSARRLAEALTARRGDPDRK
jgi:hypothetical protein